MENDHTNFATRVPVGGQELSFWAVFVLAFSIVLIFGLLVFALALRRSFWMLLAGLVATLNWLLYEKYRYGRRDWERTTYLELHDGRIVFVPSRKLQLNGHAKAEAPFPVGSSLEYRIERGDKYFRGDRGQFLRSSLWVVLQGGTKQRLLDDAAGVRVKAAAINLRTCGVPFRVLKTYTGEGGEYDEADVTARVEGAPGLAKVGGLAVLIGTSSLWLGLLAGLLIHDVGSLVASGIVACALISILTIYSKNSRRTGVMDAATTLPIYAAEYVFAVIVARYFFRK